MFYWLLAKIREFLSDGCSGDCRQGRCPCNCERNKK